MKYDVRWGRRAEQMLAAVWLAAPIARQVIERLLHG